ncbi:MAG: DUF1800 domain-containing protein [Chthoniobacterales bacterium]
MLTPLPPASWTLEHAAHLLNRAGFGGTPDQIRALHKLGLPAAIETLFTGYGPQLPAPDWTNAPPASRKDIYLGMDMSMSDAEKKEKLKEAIRQQHDHIAELRTWWLERMRESRQPLLEKMTLFWHGHFATSFVKVKNAWFMWKQNETFRSYAFGNFGELLRAMTRDPAMIRWLDLGRSRKGEPNENFAREVMELFTLGEGHYTEQDIKEGARAFTGHRIDPETQEFVFMRRAHDYGEKKFLGHTGDFNADDIVAIILAQDQCSRFISKRILEFFVAENPAPALLEASAQAFRKSNYEMKPLLRALFAAQEFYAPAATRTQIKGPVDWMVNACIALDAPIPREPALDAILTRLGQLPFEPPNVRGWEGGKSWISSSTLVLRYNLTGAMLGTLDKSERRFLRAKKYPGADMQKVAPADLRDKPDALADALVFRIFGTPQLPKMQKRAREAIAEAGMPVTDAGARAVCQKLMSTPDFQLT